MKGKLLSGFKHQILIIDNGGFPNTPQPVIKSIILPRSREIVQREVESPGKNPLIWLLLNIFVQLLLVKITFLCFNLIVLQKILIFRHILGGPA